MTEPAYRVTRKVLSMPVRLDSVNVVTESSKSFVRNKTLHKDSVQQYPSASGAAIATTTTSTAAVLCVGVLVFSTVAIFSFFLLCASRDSSWTAAASADPDHAPWRQAPFVLRLPQRPWSALQQTSGAALSEYDLPHLRRPTGKKLSQQQQQQEQEEAQELQEAALEGMGTLFRRGKRAMTELLVAHLSENTSAHDLRVFLRTLHRSGMTARADVVLLFPWRPLPQAMLHVIREEEQSFRKLLHRSRRPQASAAAAAAAGSTTLAANQSRKPISDSDIPAIPAGSSAHISVFNAAAFWKTSEEPSRGQSIWGCNSSHGFRGSSSSTTRAADSRAEAGAAEYHAAASGRVVYGSVVGFDMQELDPADAMRAFINEPPAELRRWVCYQILLGMLRQKYRHVMLSEVRGVIVLKDLLAPLKKKDTGLYLFAQDRSWSDIAVMDTTTTTTTRSSSPPSPPLPVPEAAGKQPAAEEDEEEEEQAWINNVAEITTLSGSIDVAATKLKMPERQQQESADRWELQEEAEEQDDAAAAAKLRNPNPNPERKSLMDLELQDGSSSTTKAAAREQQQRQRHQHAAGRGGQGLIERVYGKEVWDSLEKEEKRSRRLLSSGVIAGGIRSVRTLASAMATEIVRVAILRKSRHPFGDEAILSFLIHKSSVLGSKVSSHLHVLLQQQQQHPSVKLLSSGGASNPNFFFAQNGVRFAVILGFQDPAVSEEKRNKLLASVHNDICFDDDGDSVFITHDSYVGAHVYADCARD